MTSRKTIDSDLLLDQLSWFTRLRWVAAATVVLVGLTNLLWMRWYPASLRLLGTGAVMFGYNVLFWVILRRSSHRALGPLTLMLLTWAQIISDLACVTFLVILTGGLRSPVLGFSVFHMMISSLLLPQFMAFAVAAVFGVMLNGGLWLAGQYPTQRGEAMILLGWFVTQLVTIYLTSNIAMSLRRHHRRARRQNYRIRSMSRKLRRQQQAMIQQDKMVAMGQMAAGIAHEIVNPLANMKSLLALAKRHREQLRTGDLEKLKEQIDRIDKIIRQLTEFAHPAESPWERALVQDVVDHTLQMIQYAHRIREVKIDVRRNLPLGGGQIRARRRALEQVLVNIILNALDAMEEQSQPKVVICLRQRDRHCLIEVSDNGTGIAPEHITHVFEPFFTTKSVGKGTGLGLAISYSIVREHGGTLSVESSATGSQFTISLPIAAEDVS